jgi:hypothetical protein
LYTISLSEVCGQAGFDIDGIVLIRTARVPANLGSKTAVRDHYRKTQAVFVLRLFAIGIDCMHVDG